MSSEWLSKKEREKKYLELLKETKAIFGSGSGKIIMEDEEDLIRLENVLEARSSLIKIITKYNPDYYAIYPSHKTHLLIVDIRYFKEIPSHYRDY